MKLTVFTPTYNRAYTIPKLYDSLKKQTYKDFEWLIVDDGSNDNTEELINMFVKEGFINIKYYKKNNGGKHTAINKGLSLAEGELFFIVDSDDYLTPDAIEKIIYTWEKIENKDEFCGVAGLRGYDENTIIGTTHNEEYLDSNVIDYKYKYKIKGDKSEVFVTEILRRYKFPEFENENFIPEIVVWIDIGSKYKMRWFNEIIYLTEYLDDGLSWNNTYHRTKNINGTLLTYSKLINYNLPMRFKFRYYINYYRFLFLSKSNFQEKKIRKLNFYNFSGIILGFGASVFTKIKDYK